MVGGGKGLLEAGHLGEGRVVVTERGDYALDNAGPQQGRVAGSDEAHGRCGDGEAGREAGKRPALGLAVLDNGGGDGGVHGGEGLACGCDDDDFVDDGRESVAHPLEEGPAAGGSRRPCRSRNGGSCPPPR